MGRMTWQPKWWSKERHETAWERAKEALKRDWEQTKSDVHAGGRDLKQNVGDTVKQAQGKEAIPPRDQPNIQGPATWDDIEVPMRYGFGAREQYGQQYSAWNDQLESTLRKEWEEGSTGTHQRWNDVKNYVRRGYER